MVVALGFLLALAAVGVVIGQTSVTLESELQIGFCSTCVVPSCVSTIVTITHGNGAGSQATCDGAGVITAIILSNVRGLKTIDLTRMTGLVSM